MAYSCGYWTLRRTRRTPSRTRSATSSTLVCRKLGLEPGMTLLDVGCGWGSLSLHAAEHFGARVTGVTIAAEQKGSSTRGSASADSRTGSRSGCRTTATCAGARYDAVASIEMGEHVGEDNYPTYVAVLRTIGAARRSGAGAADVAHRPASRRRAVHRVASSHPTCTCGRSARPSRYLERGGLEVRDVHALREHYVRTVARLARERSRPTSTGSSRSSARRWSGSGGSTWSAGRWRSATAGWASTRSCVRPGAEHSVAGWRSVVSGSMLVLGRRARSRSPSSLMAVTASRRAPGRPGLGRRRRRGGSGSSLVAAAVGGCPRRRRPAGAAGCSPRWSRSGACGWRGTCTSAASGQAARTRATPSCSARARRLSRRRRPQGVPDPGRGGVVRRAAGAGRRAGRRSLVAGWSGRASALWLRRRSSSRRSATPSWRRTSATPTAGRCMDRGLWAWTRHPNYFGDACVWWGIWLAGGAATAGCRRCSPCPAPVAMTYFLVCATGARPLEKTMMKRPGYPEYAARTSLFFPLPQRRSR